MNFFSPLIIWGRPQFCAVWSSSKGHPEKLSEFVSILDVVELMSTAWPESGYCCEDVTVWLRFLCLFWFGACRVVKLLDRHRCPLLWPCSRSDCVVYSFSHSGQCNRGAVARWTWWQAGRVSRGLPGFDSETTALVVFCFSILSAFLVHGFLCTRLYTALSRVSFVLEHQKSILIWAIADSIQWSA